jgi:SpoIID/LytB domain protein
MTDRTGKGAGFTSRLLWTVVVTLLLVTGLGAPAGAAVGPAAQGAVATADQASDEKSWTITGKGYGHGRGLGQWGSFGYATVYRWGPVRITDHFYGGTRLATDAGNPVVRVHLLGPGGSALHVTGSALQVDGAGVDAAAVRVRRTALNTFAVDTAGSCAGPWTASRTVKAAEVAVNSRTGGTTLCQGSARTGYRGSLIARETGSGQATVNRVRLDDYLAGVLPSEVPPSWGSASNGQAALRAQAVAARSYALSSTYGQAWADTCDTTACQVYSGTSRLDPRTTEAVQATSGWVRRTSTTGAIARTEFSASTGGQTAGGTFPSVVDLGDAVEANPNRSWEVSFTASQMGAATGVGTATSVRVDSRDGNGTWGGRVLQLTITGTTATRTMTGAQFRTALGLKSTYLTIAVVSGAEDRAFVEALYVDVLGRPADPAGLDSWSRALANGTSRKSVVTSFVRSDEHVNRIVARLYQNAVLRAPGGSEQQAWVDRIQDGQSLVQVYAEIYGSSESFRKLGDGDLRTWVDAVYRTELGRAADPAGLDTWTSIARRDGRVAAARGIISSAEASTRRLDGYYRQMLGRGVDPAGRSTWLSTVRAGQDLQVIISLGLSGEYWNRAQDRFGEA